MERIKPNNTKISVFLDNHNLFKIKYILKYSKTFLELTTISI